MGPPLGLRELVLDGREPGRARVRPRPDSVY